MRGRVLVGWAVAGGRRVGTVAPWMKKGGTVAGPRCVPDGKNQESERKTFDERLWQRLSKSLKVFGAPCKSLEGPTCGACLVGGAARAVALR